MLREALGASAETPVPELIRKAREILAAAGKVRADTGPARELSASHMALLSELHSDRTAAALERARATGKLVPAMEGWAQELGSSNLDAFEAWEASAVAQVNLGDAAGSYVTQDAAAASTYTSI